MDICHQRGICKATSDKTHGTTGPVALPLLGSGYEDIKELQAYVRAQADKYNALKCEYKSTNQEADGQMWGRQSVRAKASRFTCDDWAFGAGQPITLLGFQHKQEGVMQQHQRWFATMELAIPKPAAFKPVEGESADTAAAQSAPLATPDHTNDWMEYMGR